MSYEESDDEDLDDYDLYPRRTSPKLNSSRSQGDDLYLSLFRQILFRNKPISVNGIQYNVLEKIGSGKFSKIYKVFDDGNFYALKKIKYSSNLILENYKNEINLLQELQDEDKIINIIDSEINKEEKTILILLELGDADLKTIIASQEKLTPNYLRYTLQQMLEAVQIIHNKKIIHGNLKPSNFLMVKRTLKLIDFGFAKVIENDKTSTDFYQQYSSIQYGAPESFSNKTQFVKLGTSADVWSIGYILYELVYGHSPFPTIGMQFSNERINIKYDPLPNFPDFELLKNVMQMCLQRNPKQRPSIEDLLFHPYIQQPTASFVSESLSIADNLGQLAKQIQRKYSDREFNCDVGHKILQRIAKDLTDGKPMIISPRA